jgi:hypothetical protein
MQVALQLHCGGRDDDHAHLPDDWRDGLNPAELEDLPYRIEVWDESATQPEMLVAVTVSPALAYAAYYAAGREYAGRDVTLKHKGMILSHWRARPI